MIQKIINQILLLLFLAISIFSCKDNDGVADCVPKGNISVSINMDFADYIKLKNIGGYIYLNITGTGTRGLIIVNSGNNKFMAYDRNAPHICPTSKSTLEVKDDLMLYCPEDGATWLLSTGQPLSVTSIPPVMYNIQRAGNTLFIN